MQSKIQTHILGKLRIYMPGGEKVQSEKLIRKVFPLNVYRQIISEAKKEGIMNAAVFSTHFGYSNNEPIRQQSTDSDNTGLTICVELIDKKEKLEDFFRKHKNMLKGKVVVYKEVEFWDID